MPCQRIDKRKICDLSMVKGSVAVINVINCYYNYTITISKNLLKLLPLLQYSGLLAAFYGDRDQIVSKHVTCLSTTSPVIHVLSHVMLWQKVEDRKGLRLLSADRLFLQPNWPKHPDSPQSSTSHYSTCLYPCTFYHPLTLTAPSSADRLVYHLTKALVAEIFSIISTPATLPYLQACSLLSAWSFILGIESLLYWSVTWIGNSSANLSIVQTLGETCSISVDLELRLYYFSLKNAYIWSTLSESINGANEDDCNCVQIVRCGRKGECELQKASVFSSLHHRFNSVHPYNFN